MDANDKENYAPFSLFQSRPSRSTITITKLNKKSVEKKVQFSSKVDDSVLIERDKVKEFNPYVTIRSGKKRKILESHAEKDINQEEKNENCAENEEITEHDQKQSMLLYENTMLNQTLNETVEIISDKMLLKDSKKSKAKQRRIITEEIFKENASSFEDFLKANDEFAKEMSELVQYEMMLKEYKLIEGPEVDHLYSE